MSPCALHRKLFISKGVKSPRALDGMLIGGDVEAITGMFAWGAGQRRWKSGGAWLLWDPRRRALVMGEGCQDRFCGRGL
ncbi:hypothetical protein TIFTF001_009865 [Ficus carica]|uniref:Uncharacterized protein n=1 Tax=Ficus carica TaxID=3494 RepID=A0AA87ZVV5_FICCA|nr:hypothetical protein TIFTF001_009865 [Ficus carica]